MRLTRRELLKAGFGAAALTALPPPVLAYFGANAEPVPPIEDPRIKALALRALEAARAAGATYADTRLTHTRTRSLLANVNSIEDKEQVVAGVRAWFNGHWGFASSPVWSPDEMARLGREAVEMAKVVASGRRGGGTLAPMPRIADGHWTMPVEIDPFEVSPFEIVDYLGSLTFFTKYRIPGVVVSVGENRCEFQVQEKAFASSEGSYCTQRLYRGSGILEVVLTGADGTKFSGYLDLLSPAGKGWELYKGQPVHDAIEELVKELREYAKLPPKPVDVGRYDTIFDALTVARLVDGTLGKATELDRALGFETNAGGTSYLNDPAAMVGSYQAGPPLLNLSADRSDPGGAATVRWDDEGVEPNDFDLIRDGVLIDFQTTRETANRLADYYAKTGQPVRSHGCAAAPSALEAPLSHLPNLKITPGSDALDFEAAVAALDQGIAIRDMGIEMDFQALNGLGVGGRIYEIKGGKKVGRILGAGLLFRAPELWKQLRQLGGVESIRRYGMPSSKGEPAQLTYHSVTAPPAAFEQLTVIDITRKA